MNNLRAHIEKLAEEYADGFFRRSESASWLSEKATFLAGSESTAEIFKLQGRIEALEEINCTCTVAEQLSGHMVGCWKQGNLEEAESELAALVGEK